MRPPDIPLFRLKRVTVLLKRFSCIMPLASFVPDSKDNP
jgi:hypothetical protein